MINRIIPLLLFNGLAFWSCEDEVETEASDDDSENSILVGTWSVLSEKEYSSSNCDGEYVDMIQYMFMGGEGQFLINLSEDGSLSSSINVTITEAFFGEDFGVDSLNCGTYGLYLAGVDGTWVDSGCVIQATEYLCENLDFADTWTGSACEGSDEGFGIWSSSDDTLCLKMDGSNEYCREYSINGELLEWKTINEQGCAIQIMQKQ